MLVILYGLSLYHRPPVYLESIAVSAVLVLLYGAGCIRLVPMLSAVLTGEETHMIREGDRTFRRCGTRELFKLFLIVLAVRLLEFPLTYIVHYVLFGYTGTFFEIQRLWLDFYHPETAFPLYGYLSNAFWIVTVNFNHARFIGSYLFTALAVVALYYLVQLDFDRKIARRTVRYFLLLPFALTLMGTVPDGLFLLFSVLTLLFLRKKKFRYQPVLSFRSPDIRRVLILTLPLFVAAMAQPINQLISSNISSTLGDGTLASVNYAYQAYFIVSGIFSYCLTNLFFPEMSRCFSRGDKEAAKGICRNMLASISAIVLPIMAFIGGNSKAVIRLLYQRKNFTAEDSALVGALLAVYALAMLAYSYQEILNKFFYSMQKVILPVATALTGIAVNLGVAVFAVRKIGVYGLAIGTVAAAFVMAVMLVIFTARVAPGVLNRGLIFTVLKDVIAAAALFIAARETRIFLEIRLSGTAGTLISLVAGLVVGLAVYTIILWLLRSAELKALFEILIKKTKKE